MRRFILLAVLILMVGAVVPAALADEGDEEGVSELSAAQQLKVDILADYFAPGFAEDPEDEEAVEETRSALEEHVVGLRTGDPTVGWGAMFKLMAFADAKGLTVEELLAAVPIVDGEYEFSFGQMRKSLSDDELDHLGDGARNFGQLMRAEKSGKPAKTKNKDG